MPSPPLSSPPSSQAEQGDNEEEDVSMEEAESGIEEESCDIENPFYCECRICRDFAELLVEIQHVAGPECNCMFCIEFFREHNERFAIAVIVSEQEGNACVSPLHNPRMTASAICMTSVG